jgi:hypothetical protein
LDTRVLVYPLDGSGDVAPIRTIAGAVLSSAARLTVF